MSHIVKEFLRSERKYSQILLKTLSVVGEASSSGTGSLAVLFLNLQELVQMQRKFRMKLENAALKSKFVLWKSEEVRSSPPIGQVFLKFSDYVSLFSTYSRGISDGVPESLIFPLLRLAHYREVISELLEATSVEEAENYRALESALALVLATQAEMEANTLRFDSYATAALSMPLTVLVEEQLPVKIGEAEAQLSTIRVTKSELAISASNGAETVFQANTCEFEVTFVGKSEGILVVRIVSADTEIREISLFTSESVVFSEILSALNTLIEFSVSAQERRQSSEILRRISLTGRSVPVWEKNGKTCSICNSKFFLRYHHCRQCGKSCCGSCAGHYKVIPEFQVGHPLYKDDLEGKEMRVCTICVNTPMPEDLTTRRVSVTIPSLPVHLRSNLHVTESSNARQSMHHCLELPRSATFCMECNHINDSDTKVCLLCGHRRFYTNMHYGAVLTVLEDEAHYVQKLERLQSLLAAALSTESKLLRATSIREFASKVMKKKNSHASERLIRLAAVIASLHSAHSALYKKFHALVLGWVLQSDGVMPETIIYALPTVYSKLYKICDLYMDLAENVPAAIGCVVMSGLIDETEFRELVDVPMKRLHNFVELLEFTYGVEANKRWKRSLDKKFLKICERIGQLFEAKIAAFQDAQYLGQQIAIVEDLEKSFSRALEKSSMERILVRCGMLSKVTHRQESEKKKLFVRKEKVEELFVHLFNDVLVYSEVVSDSESVSYKVRRVMRLHECTFSDRDGIENAMTVHTADKSVILIASDADEKEAWMADMQKYSEKMRAVETEREESVDEGEKWVDIEKKMSKLAMVPERHGRVFEDLEWSQADMDQVIDMVQTCFKCGSRGIAYHCANCSSVMRC